MRKTMLLSALFVAATLPLVGAHATVNHDLASAVTATAASTDMQVARESTEGARREDRRQDRRQDRRNDRRSSDAGTQGVEQETMILAREGSSGGHRQRRGGERGR